MEELAADEMMGPPLVPSNDQSQPSDALDTARLRTPCRFWTFCRVSRAEPQAGRGIGTRQSVADHVEADFCTLSSVALIFLDSATLPCDGNHSDLRHRRATYHVRVWKGFSN